MEQRNQIPRLSAILCGLLNQMDGYCFTVKPVNQKLVGNVCSRNNYINWRENLRRYGS
jgi:hypothetical protein